MSVTVNRAIIDLTDRFAHGETDRRRFVDELARMAGGASAASALLAVRSGELSAGVVSYGRQVAAERVPTIRAALLLHHAEQDERITAGIETYRAALATASKCFEIHLYPGTQHAFNNDTDPVRYERTTAELG